MRKSRLMEEQIIVILQEHETGAEVAELLSGVKEEKGVPHVSVMGRAGSTGTRRPISE